MPMVPRAYCSVYIIVIISSILFRNVAVAVAVAVVAVVVNDHKFEIGCFTTSLLLVTCWRYEGSTLR